MFHLFKSSWIGGMLIFSVNEAIGLIKLIGLIMIAEVRLGKCSESERHQTAEGSTFDTILTADTFLDDKTKIFSLKLYNKAQGYPFILNTLTNQKSQIIN